MIHLERIADGILITGFLKREPPMPLHGHYNDVIMSVMASQITSLTIVYSTVYSGVDQRKHQNSASLAFLWGIHPLPVNSPHKGPVTLKVFPFDDVMMISIDIHNPPVMQLLTRDLTSTTYE